MSPQEQQADFENEVRRIARAKWPAARYSGASMLDGRERDGIFETEDSINFVEATVSGSASKAKEDTKKLFKSIVEHNRKATLKIGVGWFVTKLEPTADQRKEVAEHGKGHVKAVSFAQLQQSLVDVRGYLAARMNHAFGSVQAFANGSKEPEVPFVEIGLSSTLGDRTYLLQEIIDGAAAGGHFAITGHYGAGKSMTLREIFLRLEQRYIRGSASNFPVYINLREHSGQRDPVEILERHARSIGFDSPSSLIRAWRAGFVILLIDGFDEIASLGVQGSWKKLRELRMRSLEGVRRLIKESAELGVVVTGRAHYFEDAPELCAALGFEEAEVLTVDEFTPEQVKSFLARFSLSSTRPLPDWLPTRPLLLGYLASKGLLASLDDGSADVDAVDGWNYLLARIYQREQGIETNLDGATLRQILERAATVARVSEDSLGPISRKDLFSVFSEVCGYEPDEQGILAIQRLPGLGLYRAEDESRCFVDKELAEVCAGNEFARFVVDPFGAAKSPLWVEAMNTCDRPLGQVGVEASVRRFPDQQQLKGSLTQAAYFLSSRQDLDCVRGDLALVSLWASQPLQASLTVRALNLADRTLQFEQSKVDHSNLAFKECFFDVVSLSNVSDPGSLPRFESCYFERISGRASRDDLPENFSADCEIHAFDSTQTAGAIREGHLSVGEKVLLITLRKLFIQSLSGRAESALYRGLDIDERRYVADVLKILVRADLARETSRGDGVVWLPTRKALSRVKKILSAPRECGEAVVEEARRLA